MSFQMNPAGYNRFILASCAATLLMMSAAVPAQTVKAKEPVNTVSKTLPAEPMDHSKMAGMGNMNGMKHADGSKHTEGMSMTGDSDYDFAVNMRQHHQMAVEMSKAELKNGTSPKLRTLATNVIAAQNKEIATLDAWLAAYDKDTTKAKKY